MATAIDAETRSDKFKDAKCSICAQENRDEIADYYCCDCNKHMCKACLGTHNRFSVNHNIVQGLGDGKDVLTEKCGKHADELITLYCRQDDELLCRKCHLLDHRKCQDAQNIRESPDELNAQPELEAVPAQLKSALDIIKKAIIALDMHVANIEKNGSVFLKDLEVYANKLLSLIEELKEKGKKDIKSKQDELLAVAKHYRQACALTKDEISQCLQKIPKSNEWKANMFVIKKKCQKIPQKVNALFTESKNLIEEHQFHFKTDKNIFDSLKSFNSLLENVITNVQNIGSLGAVVGAEDRSVQATVERQRNSRVVGQVEKRSGVKAQNRSKQVRMVKVKLQNDKDSCYISGCCYLDNGSLLIADRTNRRLKLVDPSGGKITKYCDTDERPTSVCSICPQEVAVAFGSTQVQVYNAVSLTRTRIIELRYKTPKIACHGGLLYCTGGGWGDTNNLNVHNVSNVRKLREIHLNIYLYIAGFLPIPYISGNISGVAVNGSGDRLYVTGWEGLYCVNMDGQQIFYLSEKDLGLSDAQGVTTDHHGHVFVCGQESNNVVKVTEDGHVVGEILSGRDGIVRPSCLSYDVSRNQVCVGWESDQILMVEGK